MRDLPFTLVPAKPEHCRLVFELANEPYIRQAGFSKHIISFDEHCTWFKSKLAANVPFYLALSSNTLAGYVRFEPHNQEAIISTALAKNWQGQGLGYKLIEKGCELAFAKNIVRIIAWILPHNIVSAKAFTKAGFKNQGLWAYQNSLALRLEFEKT